MANIGPYDDSALRVEERPKSQRDGVVVGTGEVDEGEKKSFQVKMNVKIAVVARAGVSSGRMIRQKIWKKPAPSISAASSSSRGVLG